MGVNELVFVSFLSEMKVGSDCVLEEMNDQISEQNQKCRIFASSSRLAGKISTIAVASMNPAPSATKYLEIRALPVALNDDGAAKHIGGGGG